MGDATEEWTVYENAWVRYQITRESTCTRNSAPCLLERSQRVPLDFASFADHRESYDDATLTRVGECARTTRWKISAAVVDQRIHHYEEVL